MAAPPQHPSEPSRIGRVLPDVEVFAQSIAYMGPSATIAIAPAIVAATAGNGVWFAYLVSTVCMLGVAYTVGHFARRVSGTGSLYTFSAKGFGPLGGLISGATLLLGYFVGAATVTITGSIYFGAFLGELGIDGTTTIANIAIFLALAGGSTALSLRGVYVATRVALFIEIVSIAAIVLVLIVTIADRGTVVDVDQLTLEGTSVSGIALGVVIAIVGLAGFESAASLGLEAKDPYRAVPRAMLRSVALTGALLIAAAYAVTLGFDGPEGLLASTTPLNDLTADAGLGGMAWLIDLGVTFSAFAALTASVNAGSRLLLSMGRERVLPQSLGSIHRAFRTPHVALAIGFPVVAGPPVVLLATGSSAIEAVSYLAFLSSLAMAASYGLVSLAAPLFLRRRRALTGLAAAVAVAAAAAMAFVIFKTLSPAPPAPQKYLPFAVLGAVCLGAAWFAALRAVAPERTRDVGSFSEDGELAPAAQDPAGLVAAGAAETAR